MPNLILENAIMATWRLQPKIIEKTVLLGDMKRKECGYKKDCEIPVVDGTWTDFHQGDTFGARDKHFWLISHVEIPQDMRTLTENEELILRYESSSVGDPMLNPQMMLFVDGKLCQGGDNNHRELVLDPSLSAFDFAVYAYSGMPKPNREGEVICPNFTLRFSLQKKNKLVEKVYYDIKVLLESAQLLDENTLEFHGLTSALKKVCSLLNFCFEEEGAFEESLRCASEAADKFFAENCKKGKPQIACVGHTHIDIAWLWTIGQTREKAQRSFANMLALMDKYPEFKFMSSQPVLFKFVKAECPELYERVRENVKEGRFEVEGGMWVEADCNLTSGESLVRQFLKGKSFFKNEFGVDCKVLWLPDVFGYSAALPQILKKSGIDTIVTSKISWNDTNTMPYDIFMWKGIDGSEVFTTFLTAQDKQKDTPAYMHTTYNAHGTPAQVLGSWDRMQQKDLTDEAIITFGYGDGGGGSTSEDIEQITRMQNGLPGIPTAKFDTVTEYIRRMKKNCKGKEVPKWVGELYLEFHRGTYTTHADNKRYNRLCEFAYTNYETLSVLAEHCFGEAYPWQELNEAWEKILTYQFHDIIPGSSIGEVYEDTSRQYPVLLGNAESQIQRLLQKIADNVQANGDYLVYNPNSFEGDGFVAVDGKYYRVKNIPSKGYTTIDLVQNDITDVYVKERYMENEYYRITFDENYEIESLYCKKQDRELVEEGKKLNTLVVYNDYTPSFDAWDIRPYYKYTKWAVNNVKSVAFMDEGARKGIQIVRTFEKSEIKQTIYLYDDFDRIDFVNDIDWQTEHVLLKTHFPFAINATKATYDIQFGNIERATHANTSWDEAKFEVCAHKYADVSDGGFGVALLNDCKYGYSADGGELTLTLLRTPTFPHKGADIGKHTFTYSLYAHEGSVCASRTIERAYDLNNPMIAVATSKKSVGVLPGAFSLVNTDKKNVIVESVKKAEDGNGDIVRLYESKNTQTKTKIAFGLPIKKAYLTNLMEEKIEELSVQDNAVTLSFRGFEIHTLRLVL